MDLIRFIENRYQETRLRQSELETKEKNTDWVDAEIKSLHNTLNFARGFLRWCHLPLIFARFFLVNIGLVRAPKPVLLDMLREQRAKEAEAKAEKEKADIAKSVGMNHKKKPAKVTGPTHVQ